MSEQKTFEQAVTRLEEIVQKLENGQCTLEESLKLFEEGAALTAFCNEELKAAQQKIVQLTLNGEQSEAPAAAEGAE